MLEAPEKLHDVHLLWSLMGMKLLGQGSAIAYLKFEI
jgi:hypothetical protein